MPTILIVDDEREICDILSEYLQQNGFRVLKAYSGEAALDLIERDGKVGLIILDLGMPGIGGMGVLKKLHAGGVKTPVLLLTGTVSEEAIRGAQKLGYDDFIIKPVALKDLLEKSKQLLK